MHIVYHATLSSLLPSGERCLRVADRSLGIGAFEVRLQTLEPGAQTDEQRHAGELVVVALGGGGKLLIDGGPQRFNGPCTLVIPPERPFQVANNGTAPLDLVWVFTTAPVGADAAA